MLGELTEVQKFYFDRLRNKKLQILISNSYTFFTMSEDEKLDLLIKASVLFDHKEVEEELIEILKNNEEKSEDAMRNAPKLKPGEKEKMIQAMDNETSEIKSNIQTLKNKIRVEKEAQNKDSEKEKMDSLLNQLNN
jgi:hypothetical protein